MKIKETLRRIGLTEKQADTYLVLLGGLPRSVSDIVMSTGLHRPAVYKTLQSLVVRGLVDEVQTGKRKKYTASDPQKLSSLFDELKTSFTDVLPELQSRFKAGDQTPTVRVFSGQEGVKNIYKDLLETCKKGDVFFRFESPKDYKAQDKYLPQAYFDRVCEKREIEKFVITNQKTVDVKQKQLERAVRVVPTSFDSFEYGITQIIYNDSVAFIHFSTETGWIVQSASFAMFQRQLFRLLFSKL